MSDKPKTTETTAPAGTEPQGTPPASGPVSRTPDKPARLDPTRYADWEKNGRCIDF